MPASLALPGVFAPTLWQPPEQRARRHPRYYQQEAITKALTDLATVRSTLAVMATGTGKTFTASRIIKDWPGKVLWLNERDNLVSQVRGELADLLQEDVHIEQAEQRAPGSARVVVGSLQSMCQPKRLASIPRDRFTLLVLDEAHHSVSPSYLRILAHFSEARVLGLTATPDRLDGKSMGLVFEEQCADYQMLQGIEDGYLVGFEFHQARRIDVSRIKARGEFSDDQVAEVMGDDVLKAIVDDAMERAPGERGVLYFPRVDIGHVAAMEFNRRQPGIARAVDGSMDNDLKRALLRGHKRGDYLYLCNVGIVEEGYDDPGIMWIGMCRPTKSRSKYAQWAGRCTRPNCAVDQHDTPEARRLAIRASSKPLAKILDFVGNTGKHELISPVDILAGRHDTEKVKKKARSLLDADDRGDVQAAIQKARRMDEDERREEAARVARVQSARHQWKVVSPFDAFGMEGETDVATALTRASQKQRWALASMQIDVPSTLTFNDAQRLIKAGKARQRAGLADYAQVRILSRHGIPAQRMYKGTARRLMDMIAANRGWPLSKDQIDSAIKESRGQ
jgi:superfamily II DNA or RNA helicase